MGKAAYQPQPFTEAKRRGVAVTVGGTANMLKSVIQSNMDRSIIKELQQPNMAGHKEEVVVMEARQHLVKAFKRLRQLEKMLDDRNRS